MILSNNLYSYNESELYVLSEKISDLSKKLVELEKTINEHLETCKKIKYKHSEYYINPKLYQEFKSLEKTDMPLDAILEVYERWICTFEDLVEKNKYNFNNKKLAIHIADCWSVCITFGIIIMKATQIS